MMPHNAQKPLPAWTRLFSRGLQYFLLATLLLLAAGSARAALRFDVFLGCDGYASYASWFPVVCEIQNDGPAFTGVVEVSGGSYQQKGTRRLVVELPTGTTKRVTLPVFTESMAMGAGWDVKLLDERGRTRASQTNLRMRRILRSESILMGSLSRGGAWSPTFAKVASRGADLQPVAARFQPAVFPDSPVVMDGMDALYLNAERAVDLRPAQVEAIRRWLAAGGHLIVAVENPADANAVPWLRQMLPATIEGVRTVAAHTELQSWITAKVDYGARRNPIQGRRPNSIPSSRTVTRPFADLADDLEFEQANLNVVEVTPSRDARILVSAEGVPLVIQAGRGMGRVSLLTFSPERQPVRSWMNQPAFWARLTEVPPEFFVFDNVTGGGGYGVDGLFGAMIDSRQVRKLPVGWLLLLLVGYLVVIGPLDRWWLKKINKPMLTWVTFPIYVVLFSGLIYLIGYRLRAGDREYNELHVVDVLPGVGGSVLKGKTYGSIYSPNNQTHKLKGPEAVAAFRGELGSTWGGSSQSERVEVLQREESFEAKAFVPVWTSQLFVNDWWEPGPGPIKVTLNRSGSLVKVTVESRLDHDLAPANFVYRGRLYDLGAIPANGTQSMVLEPRRGRILENVVGQLGGRFSAVVRERTAAFGSARGGRIDDLPGATLAISFLSHLAPSGQMPFNAAAGLDLSRAAKQNGILVAWASGQAPVPTMSQFQVRRGQVNTCWRVPVPVNPL